MANSNYFFYYGHLLSGPFLPIFLLVFIGGVLLLFFGWRYYKQHSKVVKTNIYQLIGAEGVVTSTLEPYEYGEVKIGGEWWRARGSDDRCLVVGTRVIVLRVQGAHLIVKRKDLYHGND